MGNISSCCGSKSKKYVQETTKVKEQSPVDDPSRQNYKPPQEKTLSTQTSKKAEVLAQSGPKVTQCVFKDGFIKQNGEELLRNYEVHDQLGTGSYSVVKKALDKRTHQYKAIKVISKRFISNDEVQSWKDGVHLLFELDHPNIAKAYEIFEDKDNYYVVLELLNGGDLFGRIVENENMTEKKAASIMQQILSGVAFLHKTGIAHRDLKPDNIIFSNTTDDTIKIIDFGLAHELRYDKRMSGLVGTAYYIAPEVHTSFYNEKCDVWSCGIILHIMLSGYSPYEAGSTGEIFDMVKQGTFNFDDPVWEHVSEGAKNLITKMLEYDPEKRISAHEALKDPWIQQTSDKEFVNKPTSKEVLRRLQRFRTRTKLQEAIWVFLVSYFSSEKDINKLAEAFRTMDEDKDGYLEKNEIKKAFMQVMGMSDQDAETEAQKVMDHLDHDHDGRVDYTEFLSASISRKAMLTQEKLEDAFNMIDKNKDGQITVDELKNLYNEEKRLKFPRELWNDWVDQVGFTNDGKITLEEFKQMMLSLLQGAGSRSRIQSESFF